MYSTPQARPSPQALHLPIDQGSFLRALLRELAGSLERIVGARETAGFLGVVGQTVGRQVDQTYRAALGVPRLSHEQVAEVLVDLKRRIGGDFHVIELSDERLVLGNRRCPFDGARVRGETSLCTLTSTLLGSIAAENLGYARVVLQQTIAGGADGCRVALYFTPAGGDQADEGREYLRG